MIFNLIKQDFSIKRGEALNIDIQEVLRYLGYKKNCEDRDLILEIELAILELKEIITERSIYKICALEKTEEKIILEQNLNLNGKDIYAHLKESEKAVLMAVTLGTEVDKKINYYSKIDLKKAVIFDACTSAIIEAYCDKVEEKIREIAQSEGYYITSRYSPGYGDFSLEVQPKIIDFLQAYKKIGLSATENFILLPRKSVTAIIGFTYLKENNKCKNCAGCNLQNCLYKRDVL